MKNISQHDVEIELIAITSQLLSESGEQYRREVKLDASLQKHLGIDSLGRAELFRRIEKSFDLIFSDHFLAEAETLNDVVKYILVAEPSIKKSTSKIIISSHGERSVVDPSQANSLIDIVLMYGEKSPNKPHVYFQNENGQEEIITYGDLLKSSLCVAAGLRERGLQEGETVAIMQPTSPKFFYTFFGIMLAGGIPVPIYPPFRMHMLEAYAKMEARILRNAEVRMLVTFEAAENLSRLLQAFVPSLKVVTTVDELMLPHELGSITKPKSDGYAFIQYTSGSTNDPKGVLLSHYNLLSNIRAYGKAVKVTPDDVAVSWLPLYHDFGLIGAWLGSLYQAMPLILMTPFSFLNHPEKWLWAIHYHRGTMTGAPNFAYELCVRKIDPSMMEGLDLSSWRIAANGAEKVYPRTLEDFNKKFAPYGLKSTALMPVYGLAESTVGLTIPPLDREFLVDEVDRKKFEEDRQAVPAQGKNTLSFAGCGVAIEGHEIRIVDDHDNVLPERHVGNLQFRGPSNMLGYYNNPRATQAVYHDGWIDPGDLAYQAGGELFITGRRKDLIIKAGRNLYPAEIEELVGNVEGVRQGCVAAFGVTDPKRGTEQLIVIAETREKNKDNRAIIIEKINEVMLLSLDIVAENIILVAPRIVPKTSSGKLQRAACKTMYLEGQLSRIQIPAWMQIVKLGVMWCMQKCMDGLALLGKLIFTSYVALLLLLTVLPLYLLVRVSSHQRAAKAMQIWSRFILSAAFTRMKVIDQENISKVSPVIFAANHASYIDPLVALALAPPGIRFVAKKELLETPFIRTFMNKLDYLAVDRKNLIKGVEDTKFIEEILHKGHSVFIFPEGTFGYAAGLRPFRLGAFKVAAETNIPVCPVSIQGVRAIMRDDVKLLRPGRITVTVSSPIKAKSAEWQDVIELRAGVRAEIAKYCGEPSLDYIAAQTVAPKPE